MEVIRIPYSIVSSEVQLNVFRDNFIRKFKNKIVGVVLGNFDGFHVGHRALFDVLKSELFQISKDSNIPSAAVIMSFYPPTQRILCGLSREQAVRNPKLCSIYSVRQRCEFAAAWKSDVLALVRFSHNVASLTPDEFIYHYLVNLFCPKVLVIGDNFRFGRNRLGSVDYLVNRQDIFGFKVVSVEPLKAGGESISSTRIRQLLLNGEVEHANALLGRRFSVGGIVTACSKRGHVLGFPTANVKVPYQCFPRDGVYAGYVIVNGCEYPAITNVGFRPTFGGTERWTESHILDLPDIDLYERFVKIEFVKFLRDERTFNSADELKKQISKDVVQAKEIFNSLQLGHKPSADE